MPTRTRLTGMLAAAVAILLTAASHAVAQQAVIVVRHAEMADQSDDTALSAKGRARAKALADLLRAAGVTHIITSEFRRSQVFCAFWRSRSLFSSRHTLTARC